MLRQKMRPEQVASARPLPMEPDHRTKGLLRLTLACNERCQFCNVPVEDHPRPTPPQAELESELERFLRSGARTLTLSGGEPTLYRDRLVDVVERARRSGVPFVELQTNAVLVDDGYAEALARAGLTSAFVSLLSHRQELHDELAALPGAFERCLAGIDALASRGVVVTLNLVITHKTQELVSDYVDFVAARLAPVRSISLSAVQPHGRAAQALDLLPDYDVLGQEVPRARARAAAQGILLLNPYCGLPLCVGWRDALEQSVEACEAKSRAADRRPFGLNNRGNKRHGPPCRSCALRTRCGGAWHAYWEHRAGAGIAAPLARLEPWDPAASGATGQTVVVGIDEKNLSAIREATAPTVWVVSNRLGAGDGERLFDAGTTDLGLLAEAPGLSADRETLEELAAIARRNAGLEPQHELRVVVGLSRLGSFGAAHRAIVALRNAGVEAVRLLGRGDERHSRFAQAVQRELGIEITVCREFSLPRQAGRAET